MESETYPETPRLLRTLWGASAVAMLLFVGAMESGSPLLQDLAGTILGGAFTGNLLADIYLMSRMGRGFGRSDYIEKNKYPVSFRLHIIMRFILASMFGGVFVYGMQSLLSHV